MAKVRRPLKIVLILIFFLSLTLRLIKLGENPTFISDEASIGYNAFSILKTGKDEWGKSFPIYFKAFSEYKLPLYIYLAVPFVGLFGLNEFAVRLPSALAGAFTPVLLFLLMNQLFSGKKYSSFLALLSAFFLAISPWHFQASRMALEANLALFLTCLGVYLFLVAREKKKVWYLCLSFLVLGLTFYTYNANRVFIPLFLFFLFFFDKKKRKFLRKNWPALLIFFFFILSIILTDFRGSKERLSKVSIFSDQGLTARIFEKRVSCQENLPFLVCRGIFSQTVFYPLVFAKNYLSHFNPNFLFKGPGLAQYGVPRVGVIYWFELPFLLTGFWYLLRKKSSKIFLLSWLIAAPVANSVTGTAHPVRSLLLLPCFPLLTSLGVFYWFNWLKNYKKVFLVVTIFVFFISLGFFLKKYWLEYPLQTGSVWQSGYKPLYQFLGSKEQEYDRIWVTKLYGEPHIFYLFYSQFDPNKYQEEEGVVRYVRRDGWANIDKIGKYFFFQDKKMIEKNKKREIIVFFPPKIDAQEGDEYIRYRNGEAAFVIKSQP